MGGGRDVIAGELGGRGRVAESDAELGHRTLVPSVQGRPIRAWAGAVAARESRSARRRMVRGDVYEAVA
jgi:hypothetical protein